MFAGNYHEQVGAVIGGLLDKFILGGTLACTQLHAHVAAVRLAFHGAVCYRISCLGRQRSRGEQAPRSTSEAQLATLQQWAPRILVVLFTLMF